MTTMYLFTFALVLLGAVAKESLESGTMTKVGNSVFRRECDTMCSKVSDWFHSSDAARQACSTNAQCLGILDHTANKGNVGLCLRGSMFTQGSGEHEPFRRVCVEHKGDASAVGSVSLLQVDEALGRFTRECDMMCDQSYAHFANLDAARNACAISEECAAVVDHSNNKGFFGLCATTESLFRGSEKHEAFRAVCLESKRPLTDNVNFLQVSLAEAPARSAKADATMFQRSCDTTCDKVSDWYDSLDAARQSCKISENCIGVVDHSANKGRFGLCAKGALFARGSDEALAYQTVCVEEKRPQDTGLSLAQTSAVEVSSATATVSSMFRRECDKVCDKVAHWFDALADAQQFCVNSSGCAGVVDHSANKGQFGACAAGATFARGSDQHETFRAVCVDHNLSPRA